MNQSGHGPTDSWTDRLLLSVLFVSVIVIAAYVAIVADRGPVLPQPLNSLVFVVLATTIISAVILRVRDQIIRHIDQRYTRRAEQLVYSSGEITRDLTTQARVVASVPMPAHGMGEVYEMPRASTVAAMRRLARKLADN